MIGKLLANRYEIIDEIGDGGTSRVYRAKCHILNRFVAVKILKKEFIDDEEFVKKFDDEAKAAASIQHPNIVNIFDVGKEDDIHFIVMELMSHHTLKDYINGQDVFIKNKEVVKIALQIAEAIQVAHDKGIVHRDIKPQNILLTDDGNVKVADFGIARAMTTSTYVNTNDAIGSVHYASPEQSRGGFVDKRSDIYSFGVLLYELVTGRVPFDAETPIAIALKHLKEEAIAPALINMNINPALDKMILKCMQKDPANRYQNVYEIIERLEKLAQAPNQQVDFNDQLVNDATKTQIMPKLSSEDYQQDEDDYEEAPSKSKWTSKLIGFAGLGVALALIFLMIYFYGQFRDVNRQMPVQLANIEGMNLTEATTLLTGQGLYIEINSELNSLDVPANSIISQSPKADTMVKPGSKVLVIVSLGPEKSKMPPLQNLTLANARVELANIGLEITTVEEAFNALPKGLIISQTPEAGVEVADGDSVSVVISKGSEDNPISMPNLVGQTKSDALRLLADNGLVYGAIDTQHNDAPVNEVIEQSVVANTVVPEGTVVNFVISLGPKEEETTTADPNADIVKVFNLPLGDDKDIYIVRVAQVIEGEEIVIHDAIHRKEEENVPIAISARGEVTIRFYIDDVLFDEKTVMFE